MSLYQSLRYRFRYYFIRKKAPLSYILWSDILKRENVWTDGICDERITRMSLDLSPEPFNSGLEFSTYNDDDSLIGMVKIVLGYRATKRLYDQLGKVRQQEKKYFDKVKEK